MRSTLPGEYHLIRDNIAGEFAPGGFDMILAAFTFDNMPTEAKADALSALRTLLTSDGCLLLVVSSPAIYVNEWASFSTRDFPKNRHACDGDRVRIIMLDVPDRRPVEDVFCTDAFYRRLFKSAGLRLLDVQSPLATGKEATRWVSETRTAAWTILRPRLSDADHVTQSTGEMSPCEPTGTLKARRDWRVPALGVSLERRSKLEQSRHEVVAQSMGWHCFAVVSSYGGR